MVGLMTDISTAAKISAKPTNELHRMRSPQNSAENDTANRLSVHMMIDACDAGTWARPIFCMICALIVAPRNRYNTLATTGGASHPASGAGSVANAPIKNRIPATLN